MTKKSTGRLFRELRSAAQVEKFIEDNKGNFDMPGVSECLHKFLAEKGCTKADFVRKTNIDRSYLYHILSGQRHPSRDKLLLMSLALEMDLKETQYLLRHGGFRELYVRDVRDGLIIFSINNNYNILKTNELLYDFSKDVLK